MSNKLKKHSAGFEKAKSSLEETAKENGGMNLTVELMKKFTESEDESERITDDEFYEIVEEMSNGDFVLYKVSRVHEGKESRGMMVCYKGTTLAFTKEQEA